MLSSTKYGDADIVFQKSIYHLHTAPSLLMPDLWSGYSPWLVRESMQRSELSPQMLAAKIGFICDEL